MPVRALLTRSLLALLVLPVVALAAVGALSLGGAGLIAVAVVAAAAAWLATGIVRDGAPARSRHSATELAWRVGVGTVTVPLVLGGIAVLAGGVVSALVALTGLGTVLVVLALRTHRRRRAAEAWDLLDPVAAPVTSLSVEELGREWVRTSADLARLLTPGERQAVVARRQEALDELERRNPVGFARWLAGGATIDSDPARWVAGDVSGDPAAG